MNNDGAINTFTKNPYVCRICGQFMPARGDGTTAFYGGGDLAGVKTHTPIPDDLAFNGAHFRAHVACGDQQNLTIKRAS